MANFQCNDRGVHLERPNCRVCELGNVPERFNVKAEGIDRRMAYQGLQVILNPQDRLVASANDIRKGNGALIKC